MKRVRSDNIVDRKSNEVVPLRLLRREIRRKSPFARKGLLWDRGRPNGSSRNRRCMKFNYVIHCPCCRLSNPPRPEKTPTVPSGWSADAWHKDACGPRRSDAPRTRTSLSTRRSPRSLSTRIRQIRPSIPLLFAHYAPFSFTVPLELPPTTLLYRLISKQGESLHASLGVATTSKESGAPDSFILFFLRLISKGWEGSLFVRDV